MGDEDHNRNQPALPHSYKEICQYSVNSAMNCQIYKTPKALRVLSFTNSVGLEEKVTNNMCYK